jgi:hypothetical protein
MLKSIRAKFSGNTIEWCSVSEKNSYCRITSTKVPSFCTTTFSASLTNLTALLPQSRDTSCYVSRPILAPPPLWLQKHTDLRAHYFAHCADWWHQHRFAKVTCAWSWRLCGINPAILFAMASWAPILRPFLLYDSYAHYVTPHGIASHTTPLRFFGCHFRETANTPINPSQQLCLRLNGTTWPQRFALCVNSFPCNDNK